MSKDRIKMNHIKVQSNEFYSMLFYFWCNLYRVKKLTPQIQLLGHTSKLWKFNIYRHKYHIRLFCRLAVFYNIHPSLRIPLSVPPFVTFVTPSYTFVWYLSVSNGMEVDKVDNMVVSQAGIVKHWPSMVIKTTCHSYIVLFVKAFNPTFHQIMNTWQIYGSGLCLQPEMRLNLKELDLFFLQRHPSRVFAKTPDKVFWSQLC